MDTCEHELQVLTEDINVEEQWSAESLRQHAIHGNVNDLSDNDNNTDRWIDEMVVLSVHMLNTHSFMHKFGL